MRKSTGRGAVVALLALATPGLPVPVLAQEGGVAGVVLAERSRRPLAGAQVVADDTTLRTTTDANGRFRLSGLAGTEARLTVRRVGYRPLRQAVRVGSADLQLVLAEHALALDEVVITGTTDATERRALGNAVTVISVPEVMERGAVGSVLQLLNGRAPGVTIQPGSGVVGAGARITVRGGSSFSLGNEPLLYVDGIRAANAAATGPVSQFTGPGPISRIDDLDPDDIERIEIIKGPAAATLYGTEASTGVISIITKQGAVGPARWTFGARVGASWLRDPEGRFPTNYDRDSAGNVVSIDVVERENARGTPIFRPGRSQRYHLGVGGGTAQVRYYLAGGFDGSDGVERFNERRRHGTRLNVTLVPGDRLTLDASVGHAGGPTRLSPEGGLGGRVGSVVNADPCLATSCGLPGRRDTTRRGFVRGTPEEYDLLASRGATFEQDLDRLTTSLRAEHRPFRWLRHRLRAGVDRSEATNTIFAPRVDALLAASPFPERRLGYKEVALWNTSYRTVDYAATASAAFAASAGATPALRAATSIGGQYYRNGASFVSSSGAEFPVEGLSAISSTTGARTTEESFIEDVTLGVYAQEQLAWRDRLFVTAALRADDNSAFGERFDRVYYPKAAVSWVASDERFLRARWLTTLRLRAAYGEAGKQPQAFDALRTYRSITGPGDAPALTPLGIGNPDLGPERGRELELGLDGAFLDERLGIELTWYAKRTADAILPRELAPSSGYPGTQLFNAGEIRNSGIELLARAAPLRGERLAWAVSLSVATNHNEVTSLGDGTRDFVAAGEYLGHRVGRPVGSWFEKRVVSADMDAAGAVSNVMCDDGAGGGMPCAGADGAYGTADDAPDLYLGRTIPRVEGAVESTVTLPGHRLRLHVQVDFKSGHHKLDFGTYGRCTTQRRCRENVYPAEFDARRIAAIASGGSLVDYVIVDASFAKLRELSATWSLPDGWAAAIGARRASASLAGRELRTWTRYGGLEAEAMYLGGSRGGNYGSYEQHMLPQLTRWVVAVNLEY